MTNTAIECSNLRKEYAGQTVLRGINLRIPAGGFFALAGVNGAGKTTLIKCLLDFCELDSGSISLFGVDHRQPAARSRLAYLPERFTPPHYLRGGDFLHYMAELYNTNFPKQAVAEMFKTLDLSPTTLKKPVAHLSKGTTQKLGLSACLLSRRPLIILDEPMSGLDPIARAGLKKYLAAAKREQAFLFCTHLLHEVENISDNIGILHQARLRYHGSPKKCREKYAAESLEQAYLNCVSATETDPV